MTDGLGDTRPFIASESAKPVNAGVIPDRLAVSVITRGELRGRRPGGWRHDDPSGAAHDDGMGTPARPLPIDDRVAESWAWLRVQLRDLGRRMRVNDSWIAATAIALEIPIVTQDDDYSVDIPELQVIRV